MWMPLLFACAPTPRAPEVPPAEVPCTQPWRSWANTGQPLALTWCTGCHAASVEGEARRGAPTGVDLDTPAGLALWADRVRERVQAGDMPPGGGMPPEEQEALLAWLACGAPGEAGEAAASHPFTTPELGLAVAARTSVEEDFPEGLTVRRFAEVGDREGLVLAERYLLHGTHAEFVGYTVYDAEGLAGDERWFEPGLPLLNAAPETTQSSTVWIADGSGEREEVWTWTVTEGPAAPLDAHERSTAPWAIEAVSSSGEVHGWHLDESLGVVARWATQDDGDTWEALQVEVSATSYHGAETFPLDPDWAWVELSLSAGFIP